jgi:hypothetical protein
MKHGLLMFPRSYSRIFWAINTAKYNYIDLICKEALPFVGFDGILLEAITFVFRDACAEPKR